MAVLAVVSIGACWYRLGEAREPLRGTVTVLLPDGSQVTHGPCYAPAGAEVNYAGSGPEVILGLDCVALFRDGFEGAP